jgi:hypothetical protein
MFLVVRKQSAISSYLIIDSGCAKHVPHEGLKSFEKEQKKDSKKDFKQQQCNSYIDLCGGDNWFSKL